MTLMVLVGENDQRYDKPAPKIDFTYTFSHSLNANIIGSQYPSEVTVVGNKLTVSLLPFDLSANSFQQRYITVNLTRIPETGSTAAPPGVGEVLVEVYEITD